MNVPKRITAVQMQYVQVPLLHTLVLANQAMKEMGSHALQRKPVNSFIDLLVIISYLPKIWLTNKSDVIFANVRLFMVTC